MPTVPRHALATTRHEPGRRPAAGVPRDFADVLARAPTFAAALTLAMRHLGMMNDKLTVDATVTGSVAYKANMPARGG